MDETKIGEAIGELVVHQKRMVELLEKQRSSGKDRWDKFGTISTFLATVVLATVGGIFTSVYNAKQDERNEALKRQELLVAQIQTVEKFVPYLTGSEEQKKLAILAVSSLGNTEVATKLASLYPSEGTVAALKAIADSPTEAVRGLANEALQGIFSQQRRAVVQIALNSGEGYASGVVVAGNHVITADYAVAAVGHPTNAHPLRVILVDGSSRDAEAVSVDNKVGLALLRVAGQPLSALIPTAPTLKPNESVMAIGTRGRLAVEPAVGAVVAVTSRFVEVRFDSEIQGFGGGPVFSTSGALIGIVHSRRADDRTVDQCVRGDVVLEYLNRLKIVPGFVGRTE